MINPVGQTTTSPLMETALMSPVAMPRVRTRTKMPMTGVMGLPRVMKPRGKF